MLQEEEQITLTEENQKQITNQKRAVSRKRILIADDDRGILKVLSMMLRLEGYDVMPTAFGATLLELDEDDVPDLILLDLWLAGIDGRDICSQLKDDPKFDNIPVILISAGRGIQEAAAECMADGYLEKPFEKEELMAMVEKHLALK